jgi:hypothetical protein
MGLGRLIVPQEMRRAIGFSAQGPECAGGDSDLS